MTMHRPILRAEPTRLVGEIACRTPAHGPLDWRARMAVIAGGAALPWAAIVLAVWLVR